MAKPPLPAALQELLRQPNPYVVATSARDGSLHTAATWYEWCDDGSDLLNMDRSRRRLEHMRSDPRVALTMLDSETWYRHVSIVGRVRDIYQDVNLADIDRLATTTWGRSTGTAPATAGRPSSRCSGGTAGTVVGASRRTDRGVQRRRTPKVDRDHDARDRSKGAPE